MLGRRRCRGDERRGVVAHEVERHGLPDVLLQERESGADGRGVVAVVGFGVVGVRGELAEVCAVGGEREDVEVVDDFFVVLRYGA